MKLFEWTDFYRVAMAIWQDYPVTQDDIIKMYASIRILAGTPLNLAKRGFYPRGKDEVWAVLMLVEALDLLLDAVNYTVRGFAIGAAFIPKPKDMLSAAEINQILTDYYRHYQPLPELPTRRD